MLNVQCKFLAIFYLSFDKLITVIVLIEPLPEECTLLGYKIEVQKKLKLFSRNR